MMVFPVSKPADLWFDGVLGIIDIFIQNNL